VDFSKPEIFNLLGIIMEIEGNDVQARKYYRAASASYFEKNNLEYFSYILYYFLSVPGGG